jgi:hypothetical protein
MCWRQPRTLEELTPVQRDALRLDEAAARVAKGKGALELAIGRTLDRLFRGDRLLRLCYSREADYAREKLGVSPSAAFQWVRLARELVYRPLLERAVVAGAVSPRKALAVLPLAVGDDEPKWVEAAACLTLREIEGAVRAAGKESPEERFEAESIVLPMTPEQQDRLDAALSYARETIGPEAKRWQCLEAIAEEWLSDHAEWEGEGAAGEGEPRKMPAGRVKAIVRQLVAIEEAMEAIAEVDRETPMTDDAAGGRACAGRLRPTGRGGHGRRRRLRGRARRG